MEDLEKYFLIIFTVGAVICIVYYLLPARQDYLLLRDSLHRRVRLNDDGGSMKYSDKRYDKQRRNVKGYKNIVQHND